MCVFWRSYFNRGRSCWEGSESNGAYIYTESSSKILELVDRVPEQTPCWSGSVLNIESDSFSTFSTRNSYIDSSYLLYYTGLELENVVEDGLYSPQRISVAEKIKGETKLKLHGDAINFYSKDRTINENYLITDSKHVISACRDPYVTKVNGQYKMLFSARYSHTFYNSLPIDIRKKHDLEKDKLVKNPEVAQEINSAIGQATSLDGYKWVLDNPMIIPFTATQIELPSLLDVNGKTYLMMVAVIFKIVVTK